MKKANQLLSSEDDTNNDTSELADASLSKGEEVILLPSRKQSHESTKSQKALDNTNIATSSNTNIRETTPSPTKSNHSKPRTTNTSPLEETKTSQKSLNNSLHSVREERPESKNRNVQKSMKPAVTVQHPKRTDLSLKSPIIQLKLKSQDQHRKNLTNQ